MIGESPYLCDIFYVLIKNFIIFPNFSSCLDVALVTSLRDGMNLVSYEFVACQASKKGVLILSEVIHFFYVSFN